MLDTITQPDPLLDRLLSVIDKGKSDADRRADLAELLRIIKHNYETRGRRLDTASSAQRKLLLQKMQRNTAELGPEGKAEILWAGWLMNPHTVAEALASKQAPKALRPFLDLKLIEQLEEYEDRSIKALLVFTSEYRKTPLRLYLIEPFLGFLDTFDLWESAQPMSDVMNALFDFVGVERKHRPTAPGVRTIVREFKQNKARLAQSAQTRQT